MLKNVIVITNTNKNCTNFILYFRRSIFKVKNNFTSRILSLPKRVCSEREELRVCSPRYSHYVNWFNICVQDKSSLPPGHYFCRIIFGCSMDLQHLFKTLHFSAGSSTLVSILSSIHLSLYHHCLVLHAPIYKVEIRAKCSCTCNIQLIQLVRRKYNVIHNYVTKRTIVNSCCKYLLILTNITFYMMDSSEWIIF